MANLQVTICVRVKEGEKRRWVVANGKTDLAGPLYLRWYEVWKPLGRESTRASATPQTGDFPVTSRIHGEFGHIVVVL